MNNERTSIQSGIVVIFLLGVISRSLYAQTKPTVISTNPANGATGVSQYIPSFSITFSKAMDDRECGASTSNWIGAGTTGGACAWSADKKTMTVSRGTPLQPIAAGWVVTVALNPAGVTPWIKDAEGNVLDPYTFTFTIGGLEKIPANTSKGFSWPYYLSVPSTVKQPTILCVEPNNTGTPSDDQAVHDEAAKKEAVVWSSNMQELGCPYLIPTFPRPASHSEVYTQALDRNTLLTKLPGLERIDLQLLAMIDDARVRLAARGINVDKKIFIMGFSASGQFASRFVMLHPDRIKAASIGSPGYGPIVPVAIWKGHRLPYHTGIADLEDLIGQKFDLAAFKQVPLQIYVGDLDTNIIPWYDPQNDPESALIEATFGGSGPENVWRWANYEAAYSSVQSSSQFVVIPGMKHEWPDWAFMRDFFERNRPTPPPAPLPRPFLHTLYFPHAACAGAWQTEIAILNIGEGSAVNGELQSYDAEGGQPLETIKLTIPPAGRKEIAVCSLFTQRQNIAYLAFVSDYGFIAGYTRFTQPGSRASLGAMSGTKHGWFLKMEQDGWTGVAFVNVEKTAASVILSAVDENGIEVGREELKVEPGKKFMGMVKQLFRSDIGRARYFKYSSDKKLLGFTVSGSADNQMLDGLPSMPEYFRYLERQK